MQRFLYILLVSILVLSTSAKADTCTVTSAAELDTALAAECPEIIIPALDAQDNPVVIEVGDEYPFFTIQDWPGHVSNNYLHLTIDGTIKWVGPKASGDLESNKMFRITNATGVVIDGGGLFTSIYEYDDLSHSNPREHVAVAFKIEHAIDLQIIGTIDQTSNGMHFDNVDRVVSLETSPYSSGVTLKNLRATNMFEYGFWVTGHDSGTNGDKIFHVENCHVGVQNGAVGTYYLHGFRFYDMKNLEVVSCSAFNILGSYGIWPVTGDGPVTIDGFDTDRYCNIGPNTCNEDSGAADGDYLHNVEIHDLNITNNWLRIEQGTWRCCIEDSNIDGNLTIGRDSDDPALNCFNDPRPIDRIHWRNLTTNAVNIADNPDIGDDVSQVCYADVTVDGHVNVTDLLEVINHWGACPAAPGACAADFYPAICGDNVVNVSELLAIINQWGDCPSSTKGNVDGPAAYCMDYATNTLELEPYSEEWNTAVKECIANYE